MTTVSTTSDRAHAAGPRSRLGSRLCPWFAHARFPVLAAGIGMLLMLPSLGTGLVIDDYFHRGALRGSQRYGQFVDSPLDMFRFFDGDPARTLRMIDMGFVPWWTVPEIKAAFWRPLVVFTHWLDYQLWPDTPALMHLQSVLWYGGLLLAVGGLYRRLLSPTWAAGLATLLYAIDDGHAMPVAFLANRSTLLAALLGVMALIAHDRWRRDGWKPGAVLGPAALLLSLLAKEAGLATCGYLAAHALLLDRAPAFRRLRALLPYLVVVIAWRICWTAAGAGFEHVGLYVDPVTQPGRYALACLERFPTLMLGLWAAPPAEIGIFLGPGGRVLLAVIGAGLLAGLCFVLWPLLWRDAGARFWALGMALAALPACASFPADRLMFFPGLGAMALIARVVESAFASACTSPIAPRARRGERAVAIILLVIHGLGAACVAPLRAAWPTGGRITDAYHVRSPLDATVAQQDVILLNPPSVLHIAYFMVEREAAGQPAPRRVRQLASGLQSLEIRRPDAETLVIRPEHGYISWIFEQLMRPPGHPMTVGQRIDLTGLIIEVTEALADGRPAEATFRFDRPLEDPALRWLAWQDGQFRAYTPPAVGTTVTFSPYTP